MKHLFIEKFKHTQSTTRKIKNHKYKVKRNVRQHVVLIELRTESHAFNVGYLPSLFHFLVSFELRLHDKKFHSVEQF